METLLLPVASTAVLVSAAVQALRDRSPEAGEEACPPGRYSGPPETPSFLDKVADRIPRLRLVAAVQSRYGELGGNHLAAAFTLQAFLSLFPLLLVGIAVAGFISAGSDTDIAGRLIGELGLQGEAADTLKEALSTAESSRQTASVIGLLGLFWSGLGLVGGLQHAFNAVWQVNERGMKDKVFGLLWLAGAALLFVASAALTTALRWLPGFIAPLGVVVTFLVSFGLWLWTSKVLPNRDLTWRSLVPGALVGAVGVEVLKGAGAYWVPRAVASSSQLYGVLGIIFAILAWLLLFGRLLVYSAVVNVVLYERHAGTVKATLEAPGVAEPCAVANRAGRLVTN